MNKRKRKQDTPDEVKEIVRLVKSIAPKCGISSYEGQYLYNSAKSRRGQGVIVEIGSWKGSSTIWLAKGSLVGPKTKVYAIDPHKQTLWHIAAQEPEDTYSIFTQNIKRAGVEEVVIPLVMKSEEAIQVWNQPINLLFIDGSHEYEDVKRDFSLYNPFLEVGGIIAFHDCWERGPRKIIREKLLKSGRFSKIGRVQYLVFAMKGGKDSFLDRIRRQRLLVLNYAVSLVDFLNKFKATRQLLIYPTHWARRLILYR